MHLLRAGPGAPVDHAILETQVRPTASESFMTSVSSVIG